jgi:signal transduction histidine kinase
MGAQGGQLKVWVAQTDRQVAVTFQDTGPGISPENLKKIFMPFFTTKEKGSGLGLAICYEIIRDHGGEISVESQPGAGAAFKVVLPLKVT